jgi:nucleoside-diphosphate-sugar epimerase
MGDQVRRQRIPIIGEGQGVYSFVHIDDAVGVTAAALECMPGAYNIMDGNPSPQLVAGGVHARCRSAGAASPQRRRGASSVRPRRSLLRDEAQGRFE